MLNLEELKKLTVYKKPPSYKYYKGAGTLAKLTPPNHPLRFVKRIENKHGNLPWLGPMSVITHAGKACVIGRMGHDPKKVEKLLKKLWIPQHLNDREVQSWIKEVYAHFKHHTNPKESAANKIREYYPQYNQ